MRAGGPPGGRAREVLRWAPAAVVAVACLLPVAFLLLRASEADAAAWARHLSRPATARLLLRSLALAAAVAATASLLAVPLAWLTVRRRLPAEPLWVALFAAPLALPSYVAAQAFVAAVGPGGLAVGALTAIGVTATPDPYGFTGAWTALTLATFPYVYLPVRAALLRAPDTLEDAARSLGAGPRETFLRVVLPQARPALLSGALVTALYTLSDFGAVSLLRCATFTQVIYQEYQAAFDRTAAAMNALVLAAAATTLLVAEHVARGRGSLHERRTSPPRPVPLRGAARAAGLGTAALLAAALVGAPASVLVTWSLRGGWSGPTVAGALGAAASSLGVALAAAVAAAAAAIPVAAVAARRRGLAAALVEKATLAGYAVPGIVLGLAFVHLGVRWAPPLYQTLPLLVLAYVVLFLPQAVGTVRGSFLQADPAAEEAARSLGAGPREVFVRVTLPAVAPGVVAGALLVFVTTMKELPATLLLAPPGFATLATRVWTLTEEAFHARAAVHSLVLLAVAGAVLAPAFRIARASETLRP